MHSAVDKTGTNAMVAILWDEPNEPGRVASGFKIESNRRNAQRYVQADECHGTFQKWFGASDKEELFARMDRGWDEGASRLSEISVGEISPTSIRRRRSRSDQGDELDMQYVWRGDLPRAWSRSTRKRGFGARVINIVVNVGDAGEVNSDSLFWRGGSALRLADALITAGYSVGIYAGEGGYNFAHGRGEMMAQFAEIKAPDTQLDLSRMAGITAMPGWFRTQGFAGIVCAADMLGYKAHSGLGQSLHNLSSFAGMIGLQGEMVFQPRVNDKAAAESWIERALGQIEPGRQGAATH